MKESIDNNLEQIQVSIQREFIDRCRRNPAYSLRAFAKYLGIDQSFLSKLLKGQRSVTQELAFNVGPKLGLKPAQVKALINAGAVSLLKLHTEQVKGVLERLQRLNFIRIKEKSIKLISANNTWTNTKQSSLARVQLQRILQEKSIEAIDHIPFELRENASLTIAINSKRIPEFKDKLKEVRKILADFFQADGEKKLDEVYQLTFAFFPLTQIKKNNKES